MKIFKSEVVRREFPTDAPALDADIVTPLVDAECGPLCRWFERSLNDVEIGSV